MSELSLKGPGFEASAKRAEAAAALAAASVARLDTGATPEVKAIENQVAAEIVTETVHDRTLKKVARSTVLWVDDNPSNNFFERQSLEALGITFVLSTSTEDALEKIRHRHFDLIISDMGRPLDNKAGYTLLEKLRASGNRSPFIIYAGSRAPEHVAEARRSGAFGSTNRPDELFQMVLRALEQNR